MKLVVCLAIVLLVLVPWSNGLLGHRIGEVGSCQVVPEQLQNAPVSLRWWAADIWADWVWREQRQRRWLRLYRWLCQLRRIKQRLMRWRRVRREYQALLAGRKAEARSLATLEPAVPSTAVSQPSAPSGSLPEPQPAVSPSGQSRRGRPREIATDHLCCPHEECSSYGVLGPDPRHDIVGGGTYTTASGDKRQLYQCNICKQRFSETAGTPFFNLKTPMHTVCIALQELAEGLGIRAVARIHGVEPDTVLDWLRKAGQHSREVSEYLMQELQLSQVQLDELWTFVRKKAKMLNEWEKLHSEYGDNWIWVAFDPVHKLVVAVLIGERNEEEAVALLTRLRQRLAAGCLPLLTSDALPHYASAVLRIFGQWFQPERQGSRGRFPKPRQVPPHDLNYAIVHKQRQKGRVVKVTTKIIYGSKQAIEACLAPLQQAINTSYVERMNLSLRHLLSRLHRKTLCFSKKRECLEDHLHLALAYYHFVRYHSSLRTRLPEPIPTRGNGSPKLWQQRTPAMAAGLTAHPWTIKELLMYHVPPASAT